MRHWYSTEELTNYKKIWRKHRKLLLFLLLVMVGGVLVIFWPRKEIWKIKEGEKPINNPLKGWAQWGENIDDGKGKKLAYVSVYWSEVEPERGEFDFESLEELWNFQEWKSQETRMILRVVADSPSEEATMEIPRWLYEDMEGAGTWYENEYGKGFSPDYENRVFQEAHKELLEALGKRYNDDPQIAFIQLGSLGHWGEWHVNQHSGIQEFPDSMVTDAYVLDYVNAFPDKNLLMRRPYAITSWEQIGLYNDMFGEPEAQEEWMDWIEDGYVSEQNGEKLPSAPQFWEWGPSGGEIASSRDSSYYFGEGFQDTLRFIKESHTTYLGPNIPLKTELSEEEWKNAQRAQQEMGYCFTIRECTLQQSPRKDKKIQIKWENIGNAPFYEDWDIRIQLENEAGAVLWSKDYKEGLSEWAKTYTMERILPDTANLPKEGISVWAGIVDPMTDMCGVKLAVECPRKRGMYCLGEM